LLKDPSAKKCSQFDNVFGEGAAEQALEEHQPKAKAKSKSSDGGGAKPQQKHIDALLANPTAKKCEQFNQVFGEGAAERLLAEEDGGGDDDSEEEDEPDAKKKQDHILKLLKDPEKLSDFFDQQYGDGAAETVESHAYKLVDNPSLGPKFDQAYGAGAAKKVLGVLRKKR